MKCSKKILSLILAVIMTLTVFVPTVSASETKSPLKVMEELLTEGFPIISTEQFGNFLGIIGKLVWMLTGEEPNVSHFDVTVDNVISEISKEICAESGLDLQLIAENFPDIGTLAKNLGEKYEIDPTEFRLERYAKRDEYLAQGAPVMAAVCHAIGAFMSVIEKLEVYTVAADEPNVVKVMLTLQYQDGTTETHDAGLLINTETGECYNELGTGMFGLGYNFNFKEMVVYTTVDCWMRNFGFCMMYDVMANSMPISYSYVTRRFKFEYNGLEYMIQIWKGNYFISNGGEVGVYTREPGEYYNSFYNCATTEQELMMSMQILSGDKVLVDRPMQNHWWLSGFHISSKRYIPSLLTLKTTIVMTDEEMLNAFTAAIDANVMNDVTYTVDGLNVNLVW